MAYKYNPLLPFNLQKKQDAATPGDIDRLQEEIDTLTADVRAKVPKFFTSIEELEIGEIGEYQGETNETFINGYFYKRQQDGIGYSYQFVEDKIYYSKFTCDPIGILKDFDNTFYLPLGSQLPSVPFQYAKYGSVRADLANGNKLMFFIFPVDFHLTSEWRIPDSAALPGVIPGVFDGYLYPFAIEYNSSTIGVSVYQCRFIIEGNLLEYYSDSTWHTVEQINGMATSFDPQSDVRLYHCFIKKNNYLIECNILVRFCALFVFTDGLSSLDDVALLWSDYNLNFHSIANWQQIEETIATYDYSIIEVPSTLRIDTQPPTDPDALQSITASGSGYLSLTASAKSGNIGAKTQAISGSLTIQYVATADASHNGLATALSVKNYTSASVAKAHDQNTDTQIVSGNNKVEVSDSGILATGDASVTGDLSVSGDLNVVGKETVTEIVHVVSDNDTITLRSGAQTAIASGDISGTIVENYDGLNNNLIFGTDAAGVFRIGDENGTLEPLLTRAESANLTAGQALVWDATNQRAIGKTINSTPQSGSSDLVESGGVYSAISTSETAAKNLANASGTLAVANGGTGATTASAARFNILDSINVNNDACNDDTIFVGSYSHPSAANGAIFNRKALIFWNYIQSKIYGSTLPADAAILQYDAMNNFVKGIAIQPLVTADAQHQGVAEASDVRNYLNIIAATSEAYGVMWDTANPSPTLTRIGNMTNHALLPIQSQIAGGVMADDGTFTPFDNQADWTQATQARDGSDGQVMVRLPKHYRRCSTYGTYNIVMLSPVEIPGYVEVREQYVSAYEASLQRSTLKLASVNNATADYRGGQNEASWDGTYRTLLNRPVSYLNLTEFRTYARNRGNGTKWNCMTYEAVRTIFWLFVTEYATLNSQAEYTSELDANGYHQGGLGVGVSDWDGTAWDDYNGYAPLIPCGVLDEYGSGTAVKNFSIYNADTTLAHTFQCNKYRGIEMPLGHIWKFVDGVLINVENGDGVSTAYTTVDPGNFSSTSVANYNAICNTYRVGSYIKGIVFNADGDIFATQNGANSTSYYCDQFWGANLPSTTELRAWLFGGAADLGAHCGLACARSNRVPGLRYRAIGSRLCFVP